MPVSKSKRKKKRSAQRAAGSVGAGPGVGLLLDYAIAKELDTDAAIAELRAAGLDLQSAQVEEAEELVFDAWESEDPDERLELAATALKLYPWCGDAYGLLAMSAPPNSDIAIHLWRMAVAAAEFALKAELGENVFETYAGDFWACWRRDLTCAHGQGFQSHCGTSASATPRWLSISKDCASIQTTIRASATSRLADF
jgi:hypothetical protein